MKLTSRKILIKIFLSFTILTACGGGGGDDTPSPTPVTPVAEIPNPGNATLVFPEDNTECNTGVIVDETRSNVTFTWNSSENTTSYEVNLRNLNNNNTIKQTSTINEATILIQRGTPYEWFVVSNATGTTQTGISLTWKFYNEGPGITNYAPFPAEAVNPKRGENLTVVNNQIDLEWTASDIDEDIISYDIYLDTTENPTTLIGTTTETTLPSIPVISNTLYTWKVVTHDSSNNSSSSEIFEFRIN